MSVGAFKEGMEQLSGVSTVERLLVDGTTVFKGSFSGRPNDCWKHIGRLAARHAVSQIEP